MEKQRIKSKSESFRRLLILTLTAVFSLVVNVSLNAQSKTVSQSKTAAKSKNTTQTKASAQTKTASQTLTAAMIKELRIVPSEDQKLYAGTDIKFEIILPYIKPSDVDISIPSEQNNVIFKTLRRTEEMGTGNTKIELWYSFEKKGTYELKSLEVKIKNTRRFLQFSPITIGIDPKNQSPLASIIFSDNTVISPENLPEKNPAFTVTAGRKINFTINIQYATQITQFSWDIPKDSIFVQGQTYEILEVKYREKNISDDYIPVSDFEWTPLVPGVYSFPEFKITATGYSGIKTNLRLPAFTIQVEKGSGKDSSKDKNYFKDAFTDITAKDGSNAKKAVTEEDCQTIADLRSLEKHQLFGHAAKTRKELEQSLGLPSMQREFSVILFYISVIFVVLFAFLIVILIKRKSTLFAIFAGAVEICLCVIMIFTMVRSGRKFAITKGGQLLSIPEEKAEMKYELPSGSRVQVMESAGNWVYVQLGENGGWCSKDDVILIK